MPTVNEYIPERYKFATEHTVNRSITEVDGPVYVGNCVCIGSRCLIKPFAAIGAKGFSYGFDPKLKPIEIKHEGFVWIGDDVEVGSFSTICRATLKGNQTFIDSCVKIDDHVHIAHNCSIGWGTIICAGATLGGSVNVGEKVWIGVGATIKNKVIIGNHAIIGAGANVIDDVPACAVVAGNPARILRYR